MIVVSSGRKLLPFKKLAFNDAGEVAYYVDPESARGFGIPCKEFPSSVHSKSGCKWLPCLDEERLSIFIAGNPGAGKSYLASELINLFPDDSEVVLFTALEEGDGNFKPFKDRMYKIKMVEENLSRLNLSEIRAHCANPILLFDDVDKIRDKKIEKLTFALMEDALANGRGHEKHDGKGDVHVICTSHSLNDYKKTKYTLENSNYVGLFPASTTFRQLETLFNKLGLGVDLCKHLYEMGKRGEFRSIIIRKVAPMFIIAGTHLFLI